MYSYSNAVYDLLVENFEDLDVVMDSENKITISTKNGELLETIEFSHKQ